MRYLLRRTFSFVKDPVNKPLGPDPSYFRFTGIFGTDLPVIVNFHGYPMHVKGLLFARNQSLGRKRVRLALSMPFQQ